MNKFQCPYCKNELTATQDKRKEDIDYKIERKEDIDYKIEREEMGFKFCVMCRQDFGPNYIPDHPENVVYIYNFRDDKFEKSKWGCFFRGEKGKEYFSAEGEGSDGWKKAWRRAQSKSFLDDYEGDFTSSFNYFAYGKEIRHKFGGKITSIDNLEMRIITFFSGDLSKDE